MSDEENPAPTSAPTDGTEPLPNEVDALKAEIESMRDRLLRALADGENVRRRAEREKSEASQYAVTKFARDMVGIADNFARALAACPPAIRAAADPQLQAVLDGVEATDRQLVQALERHGVKVIETEGGKFDPNLHQAIAEVPGDGKAPGSIVDVVQTGYRIGERLLRPAMVTVARKSDASVAGPVDTKA